MFHQTRVSTVFRLCSDNLPFVIEKKDDEWNQIVQTLTSKMLCEMESKRKNDFFREFSISIRFGFFCIFFSLQHRKFSFWLTNCIFILFALAMILTSQVVIINWCCHQEDDDEDDETIWFFGIQTLWCLNKHPKKMKLRRLNMIFTAHFRLNRGCRLSGRRLELNSDWISNKNLDVSSDKLLIDESQCMNCCSSVIFDIFYGPHIDDWQRFDLHRAFSKAIDKRDLWFSLMCARDNETSVFNESSAFHRRRIRFFSYYYRTSLCFAHKKSMTRKAGGIWILIFNESWYVPTKCHCFIQFTGSLSR